MKNPLNCKILRQIVKENMKLKKAKENTFTHSLMLETPVSVDVCPTALSPTAVKKSAGQQ